MENRRSLCPLLEEKSRKQNFTRCPNSAIPHISTNTFTSKGVECVWQRRKQQQRSPQRRRPRRSSRRIMRRRRPCRLLTVPFSRFSSDPRHNLIFDQPLDIPCRTFHKLNCLLPNMSRIRTIFEDGTFPVV